MNESELTTTDQEDLTRLESLVDNYLQKRIEAFEALREIRDRFLYRKSHSTFEKYVEERFGRKRRWADRGIKAAENVQRLKSESNWTEVLPTLTHESQLRAIDAVSDEHLKPVLERVAAKVEAGKKLTAAVITESKNEVCRAEEIACCDDSTTDVEFVAPAGADELESDSSGQLSADKPLAGSKEETAADVLARLGAKPCPCCNGSGHVMAEQLQEWSEFQEWKRDKSETLVGGFQTGLIVAEPARRKRNSGYTEDFETFWAVFPGQRKKTKLKAFKAWEKAIKRESIEVIIAAAGEYAASPEGKGDFVKMPETWLNGNCWEDDRRAWGFVPSGPVTFKQQSANRMASDYDRLFGASDANVIEHAPQPPRIASQ